eukprot:3245450-Rhodomonas_salina.2
MAAGSWLSLAFMYRFTATVSTVARQPAPNPRALQPSNKNSTVLHHLNLSHQTPGLPHVNSLAPSSQFPLNREGTAPQGVIRDFVPLNPEGNASFSATRQQTTLPLHGVQSPHLNHSKPLHNGNPAIPLTRSLPATVKISRMARPKLGGRVDGGKLCELDKTGTVEESRIRPILSVDCSTESDDFVRMAKCLLSRFKHDYSFPQFLFVSMGNAAFVPLIQNWLCNTAGMAGVHERTLFLFSDDTGVDLLQANPFRPVCLSVTNATEASSGTNRDLDYDTLGYWKATQHRVHVVRRLLENDVPILLFEPDALWVSNPLTDPCLWTEADLIGFEDNNGVLGFGWLQILPTQHIKNLFRDLVLDVDMALTPFSGSSLTRVVHISGEQDLLYKLLQFRHWDQKSYASLQIQLLRATKYASGRWYDGGRGGDGLQERRKGKQEGKPFVINNNWIVGNKAKISRAKRWGHWFVQDEDTGTCNNSEHLHKAMHSMLTTMSTIAPPHGPPPRKECPKC